MSYFPQPYDETQCSYAPAPVTPNPSYYLSAPAPIQLRTFMVSHRLGFDSLHHFSSAPQILALENPEGPTPNLEFWCRGKKILIVVHGFNAEFSEVEEALYETSEKTKGVYGAIIAFVYPSQQLRLSAPLSSYSTAKDVAQYAAIDLFPDLLNQVLSVAGQVDIVAHSLGTRLVMDSLSSRKKPIYGQVTNLFLLGGVAPETSLSLCPGSHRRALPLAIQIYNIFSRRDLTVPIHTIISDEERIIGNPSPISDLCLSRNVTYVDATPVVDSHRAFLTSEVVIKFIKSASKDLCKFDYPHIQLLPSHCFRIVLEQQPYDPKTVPALAKLGTDFLEGFGKRVTKEASSFFFAG